MNWMLWVVAAYLLINATIYVSKAGKPREPITRFEVAMGLGETFVMVGLVLWGGGALR